jgi:hypothetical protein
LRKKAAPQGTRKAVIRAVRLSKGFSEKRSEMTLGELAVANKIT